MESHDLPTHTSSGRIYMVQHRQNRSQSTDFNIRGSRNAAACEQERCLQKYSDLSRLAVFNEKNTRMSLLLPRDPMKPNGDKFEFVIDFLSNKEVFVRVKGEYPGLQQALLGKYNEEGKFKISMSENSREACKAACGFIKDRLKDNCKWITEEQMDKLFDEAFVRLGVLENLRAFKAKERFIFDPSKGSWQLQGKGPTGEYATYAQRMAEEAEKKGEYPYNCFSFVRQAAIALCKNLPNHGAFECRDAASMYRNLQDRFEKAQKESKGPITSIPLIDNGEKFGEYRGFNLNTQNYSEAERRFLRTLPITTLVFFEDGKRGPSHYAIVTEQADHTPAMPWDKRWGSKVTHAIGKGVYKDELVRTDFKGQQWVGIAGGWKVAGVIIPEPGQVMLPADPKKALDAFTDVSLLQGDYGYLSQLRVDSVVHRIMETNPQLAKHGEDYVTRSLLTLNMDRISGSIGNFYFNNHMPVRMPNHWLSPEVLNKRSKGEISGWKVSIRFYDF